MTRNSAQIQSRFSVTPLARVTGYGIPHKWGGDAWGGRADDHTSPIAPRAARLILAIGHFSRRR
jgi:hypothetical protein